MEALRHQSTIAEWEPPVHAALLEPPPPKRRRKAAAAQPAAVEAAAASGSAAEMLSANAGSPKPPAPAPRSNGGASNLVIELHSATCSTTSGATSPTTVATNSAAASPTATTTQSHRVTLAEEAALLRASRTAEKPRPPKESAIDAKLGHTDAVEVFDAKGKFLHWAPLTLEGLCGHPCSGDKLCNSNAGKCSKHRQREVSLMAREDERAAIMERGFCGVPEAGGGPCQQPRGQCSIHTASWHQKREL